MNWYKRSQLEYNLPEEFNPGSLGSCMHAAELITKQLLDKGIDNFVVVEGWIAFNKEMLESPDSQMQHTWIEYNGKIYDPTLEQFVSQWDIDNVQYPRIKKKHTPQEYLEECDVHPEGEDATNKYYNF